MGTVSLSHYLKKIEIVPFFENGIPFQQTLRIIQVISL